MTLTHRKARKILKDHELRATASRLAVVRILCESKSPLSHTEVLKRLGQTDWHPATIYRNLVKLRDAGVAPVVSQAGGIARYALAGPQEHDHCHPHFVCDDCGQVACLPQELTASMSLQGPWAASVKEATVQLRGQCPDCIDV